MLTDIEKAKMKLECILCAKSILTDPSAVYAYTTEKQPPPEGEILKLAMKLFEWVQG